RSGRRRAPFHLGVVGRAQEGRMARSEPADPGRRRRADRLSDRRRLPLHLRHPLQAPRPEAVHVTMFRWYVINTYSGHENKVKTNLEHRIMSMNQAPRFRRVVVPTE